MNTSHLPCSLSEAWFPDGMGWQVGLDLDELNLPASESITSVHIVIEMLVLETEGEMSSNWPPEGEKQLSRQKMI